MIYVSGTVSAKAVRGMEETFDTLSKDWRIPHFLKGIRFAHAILSHPSPTLPSRGGSVEDTCERYR